MKSFLIDLTHINLNNINSSIPIYTFRLLSSIEEKGRKMSVLLILKEMESHIQKNYSGFEYLCYDFFQVPIFRHFVRFLESRRSYKKLVEASNCRCVLVSADIAFHACMKQKCRKISVIHDLKALKTQCNNLQNWWKIRILKCYYNRLIKTSDVVIAISNYTKTDILNFFPWVDENKIRVVYNSVLLPDDSKKPSEMDKLGDYILYVNTLCEYKNVATLLKAYCNICGKTDNQLVIVGRTNEYWKYRMIPFIKQNGLENRIVHLQDLSNEELRWLYSHASLFVTPSLHEGFGYTPIEAAICGCPVLSSTCEALPDTTQRMVAYYEPATDDKILSEKMLELLNNPPTKEQLDAVSTTFSKLYSPETQWKNIYQLLTEE